MTKRHADFTSPIKDTRPGGKDHTYRTLCPAYAKWCRIHRYSDWGNGVQTHEWYPGDFPVPELYWTRSDGTEGIKFKAVTVFCGPAAFYPSRGKRGK